MPQAVVANREVRLLLILQKYSCGSKLMWRPWLLYGYRFISTKSYCMIVDCLSIKQRCWWLVSMFNTAERIKTHYNVLSWMFNWLFIHHSGARHARHPGVSSTCTQVLNDHLASSFKATAGTLHSFHQQAIKIIFMFGIILEKIGPFQRQTN